MSENLTENIPSEEGEIKAAIDKMLVEVRLRHEKMQYDQEEIELLKNRTRAKLGQLEALARARRSMRVR